MEQDANAPAKAPRLLDQVRDALRRRHYSFRTEQSYVHWIKRFIFFSDKRHPETWGRRRSRRSSATWRGIVTSLPRPRTRRSPPCSFCTRRFSARPFRGSIRSSVPSGRRGCRRC